MTFPPCSALWWTQQPPGAKHCRDLTRSLINDCILLLSPNSKWYGEVTDPEKCEWKMKKSSKSKKRGKIHVRVIVVNAMASKSEKGNEVPILFQ